MKILHVTMSYMESYSREGVILSMSVPRGGVNREGELFLAELFREYGISTGVTVDSCEDQTNASFLTYGAVLLIFSDVSEQN